MMSFSTLAKLEETLGSLAGAAEHEAASLSDAYAGAPFRSFAQAQLPAVASLLSDVAAQEQERAASLRQAAAAAAAARKAVHPLRPVHSDFREKQRRHAELAARHEKAAKATAAADEKYQRLRAKNPASPDTRRLMNERDIAAARRDAIAGEVAASAGALAMSTAIYKKQVFEALLGALGGLARARAEQAGAQARAAREIARLGAAVRAHLEPVPEAFTVELEQLRAANY
jgi:hypothetical protein